MERESISRRYLRQLKGNSATGPMNHDHIERQIERCRRLASMMVDDDARHALEALATEYESKLPQRRGSFLINRALRSS